MNPEMTVLVDYANENLQLKIENARLRQRVTELEQQANPATDEEPDTAAS
ncbi:hypothetical protein [Brevibacterium oceani]|nr:hypothetical protein [Brevibacterium oceani]